MRREFSAGGIVYRFNEGRTEVLFIYDAFGRWSLPKGNIEQGESSAQAALREILEETGIAGEIEEPLGRVSYFYRDGSGDLVHKWVTYYLVKASGGTLKPLKEEVADARWVPLAEAMELSGYPSNREVLKRAFRALARRAGGEPPGDDPGMA